MDASNARVSCACIRAVISRMMAALAVIWPAALRMGQAEIEISTRRPALVRPTPSNWLTLTPACSLSPIHLRADR